jgi:4-hydroxythreonine-4-phosphate dehydrogenase
MAQLALTTGEPAGIGPEIALAAAFACGLPLTLIGDEALLAARARATGLPWPPPAHVSLEPIALAVPAVPGRLDARNAPYVLALLDRAIAGCRSGEFAAMVTAPIQKSVVADTGIAFSGHTEYLAERTATPQVVMLLTSEERSPPLRVALATTHLPLAAVPAAITPALLEATLNVLHADLVGRFGIAAPSIAVTGLNPHAGEAGHLGREEIEVIGPAIAAARARGIDAFGPLPADTAFVPAQLEHCDAVLAMYHDQGLPVLKHAGFGAAVNVTLGLPFVRTSVDHGTALDLAGSGRADDASLRAALRLAARLAARELGGDGQGTARAPGRPRA